MRLLFKTCFFFSVLFLVFTFGVQAQEKKMDADSKTATYKERGQSSTMQTSPQIEITENVQEEFVPQTETNAEDVQNDFFQSMEEEEGGMSEGFEDAKHEAEKELEDLKNNIEGKSDPSKPMKKQ